MFHIDRPTELLFILFLTSLGTGAAPECAQSRQEWVRLRYTSLLGNVPPTVNTGPLRDICPVTDGSSCCDQTMEREMYSLSHRQLLHQANWLQVAEQMSNDSNALEYFFRSDLEQAKNRLDQFFSRIYGYNYKLNRSFFSRFFADLENYMAGRRGRLANLVDSFFSQLRDNIVGLIERSTNPMLNSRVGTGFGMGGPNNLGDGAGTGNSGDQTVADESAEARRIKCLSERVSQLRPFDEVDVRVKARILEAYPPARMLVNVMSTASRLLSHLAFQISNRPECILGLTRYRFCALCAGQSSSSACPDSCPRLMAPCLLVNGPETAQLSSVWPRLIEAIVLATTRLERSFNFPAVNRNLQMEISEAITSLQTRYEETKSKFEAECRQSSAGRSGPTLFSSGGPSMNSARSQSMGMNHQSINQFPNWAAVDTRYSRRRRNPSSERHLERQARSPQSASPDLLELQSRLRNFPMNANVRHGSVSGGNNYHRPMGTGEHDNSWTGAGPNEASTADMPERLMRWAGQLKRGYNSLSNLFAVPGANLCPPNPSGRNSTNIGSSDAGCWNPPALTGSSPNHGISETLRQLTEATERLHQASVSNGDPDALVIQIPSVVNPSTMGAYRSQVGFSNPYSEHKQPPIQPTNGQLRQWRPYLRPPEPNTLQSNDPVPVSQGDTFDGSGAGPHRGEQLPPIENQAPQEFYPPPGQTPVNYGQQPPVIPAPNPPAVAGPEESQGSGRNTYNEPGSFYGSPGQSVPFGFTESVIDSDDHGQSTDDVTVPIPAPLSTTAAPGTSPVTTQPSVKTTTTSVTISSKPTQTSTTTTTTVTTIVVGSTTTPIARIPTSPTAEPITTTSKTTPSSGNWSRVSPAPVVVPPGNSWRGTEHTRGGPAESSRPSVSDGHSPFESQTNYGVPLPDDEDSLIQPDGVPQPAPSPPHQPQTNQQPWSGTGGAPGQGSSQPVWWENPQSGGSGYGGANYYQSQQHQPVGGNPPHPGYNWSPGRPDTPPSFGYGEGSGEKPIESGQLPVEGPEPPKPNPAFPFQEQQPSRTFGQQPAAEWSQPQAPQDLNNLVSQGSGSWTGPNTDYPEGITQWQDNSQGSGTAEPVGYVPSHGETNTQNHRLEPLPQPPVPILPVKRPEPPMSHPPAPPPEVWVPAQLGPGQPVSSVLLIREYNVQGPFYGPETVHTKQNLARMNIAVYSMPVVVVLRLLYLHP